MELNWLGMTLEEVEKLVRMLRDFLFHLSGEAKMAGRNRKWCQIASPSSIMMVNRWLKVICFFQLLMCSVVTPSCISALQGISKLLNESFERPALSPERFSPPFPWAFGKWLQLSLWTREFSYLTTLRLYEVDCHLNIWTLFFPACDFWTSSRNFPLWQRLITEKRQFPSFGNAISLEPSGI